MKSVIEEEAPLQHENGVDFDVTGMFQSSKRGCWAKVMQTGCHFKALRLCPVYMKLKLSFPVGMEQMDSRLMN